MAFSPALPALPGPLACVHPLDPELLAAGAAGLAESMRNADGQDDQAERWQYILAHTAGLPELSTPARVALLLATDRLQQFMAAQEAMEAAGAALAAELEQQAA